jgi:WSC domain
VIILAGPQWFVLGCYVDQAARSLPYIGPQNDPTMTNPFCQQICEAAGYQYAGTAYV